jgi:peptidoglycan/LPS O-acetylase OafA/YrhL
VKDKLQFVEGLRGFAALIVIFQHLVLMFYPALYTGTAANAHFSNPFLEHNISLSPLNILYNGNFAVCLFFVLSGFVLSFKYFKTNQPHIVLEYAIKRYFRLFIPVAFSILFVIAALAITAPNILGLEIYTNGGDWLKGLFTEKPNMPDVLYNMFIDVFVNGNNKYNPVLWTMGVEFLGSMMLFAALMLMHFVNRKDIVLLVIIVFLVFSKYYFYAAFFAGALISLYYIKEVEVKKTNYLLNTLLLIAGIYFASYPTAWQYLQESIYSPLLILKIDLMNFSLVLGSVLIFLMVTKSKIAQGIFSMTIFRFLGQISFSSYLIHLVILVIVSSKLFPIFIITNSYFVSFIFCASISMVIIFAFSWLVYKFIDQKSILVSNKITKIILGILNK